MSDQEPTIEPLPDSDELRSALRDAINPLAGSSSGIPYPSASDPLMEGAAAIQALADFLAYSGRGQFIEGFSGLAVGTSGDTVTKSGVYGIYNMPAAPMGVTDQWSILEVIAFDSGGAYVMQTWRSMQDSTLAGTTWARQKINGAWLPWARQPKVLHGYVQADGVMISEGWRITSSRRSAGWYRLDWAANSFGSYPSFTCAVSVLRSAGTAGNNLVIGFSDLSPIGVEVYVWDAISNLAADAGFSFICVW